MQRPSSFLLNVKRESVQSSEDILHKNVAICGNGYRYRNIDYTMAKPKFVYR